MNPSRDAGLQRLEQFLPSAGRHYQQRRNYDLGPVDRSNVSMLSPWLRRRVLLEKEVLESVIRKHGRSDPQKFVDEVFWRGYFRGWLAHRPGLWSSYLDCVSSDSRKLTADADLASRVRDAERGNTGNPAFDTWAKELVETGYLHNHARMWFASIWVFTLRLPWVLGADFFLRHLLDGDPASNTLSWRWVSGLHTPGKTYLASRENILKFTEGRLDPGPGLADSAVIPADDCAPGAPELCWPPEAVLPQTGSAWLITDEDATPPKSLPGDMPVLALECLDGLSPADPALMVKDFVKGCFADAFHGADSVSDVFSGSSEPEALVNHLRELGITELHCFYVPYGPTADVLRQWVPVLNEASIQLHQHVRHYDRIVWPWTGRGFFYLKKQIPGLLDALQNSEQVHA